MPKLIRYANEGFKGYDYRDNNEHSPKFVEFMFGKYRLSPWVYGCFAFINEIDPDALIMMRIDRGEEKVSIKNVNDDFKVWALNKPFNTDKPLIDFGEDILFGDSSFVKVEVGKLIQRNEELKRKGINLVYDNLECIVDVFDLKR